MIGTLKGFGVTDIFQLIAQQMKTGLLTLSSSKENVIIAFRDGVIQGILSDRWDLDPRTEILLKGNFITEKDLKAAVEGQKRGMGNWYEPLLAKGKLKQNQLDKASILVFRKTLVDVFQWEEGSYRFEEKDIDIDGILSCSRPTEGVILDTLRIIDELPIIRPKAPPVEDCPVAIIPMTHETAVKHDLNSVDVFIYNLIDGEKTVERIIDESLELPFDALSSIVKLMESGIIEVFPAGSVEKRDQTIAREEVVRKIKVAAFYLGLIICIAVLIIIGKPRLLDKPFYLGPVVTGEIQEQKAISERISRQVKAPLLRDKDSYTR
jgi:hypothetical protein